MSKALTGALELGAAGGLLAGAFFSGGADLAAVFAESSHLFAALAISGIASEAGAIADALSANRGTSITTRQPASPAGIIYGEYRVGGTLVYASTTGSKKDQYNKVVALACHQIQGVVNLYLDGRQVFWDAKGEIYGNASVGTSILFGGPADGNSHYDAGNNKYNFGGLVYAEQHVGGADPVGYYSGALHANDPNWGPSANGTPYGGDCAYVYVKIEYDQGQFPSIPEMRFTVRGKCNIFDPRNNSFGWTDNWALCVADVLTNTEWGLGIPQSMINTEQLITAANICDELVPLAAGGTEPRYTYNGAFDTSSSPGDILDSMMSAAGGKLTFSGGQYYIWPAAAFGSSFDFTDDDLIADVQFNPYKGNRELFNSVQGIFTAPNYPYTPAGDLYDTNGFDPDGFRQNNFNYAWQKTSYPPYAQDTLHGYASNEWLTQDGGITKWASLDLPGVISVATAQRLAKIYLLRNRLQLGSYNFKFKLTGYQMMPQDVFTMTLPQLGWSEKLFQVETMQLSLNYSDEAGKGPDLYVEVTATDYDPDTYAWTIQDELSIIDQPIAAVSQGTYEVGDPSVIELLSGGGTDLVNGDGIVVPRVKVTWNDPQDVLVTSIEVQWSPTGKNAWVSCQSTPVGSQFMYILGLTAGMVIDVQLRSARSNGARGSWVQLTNYTVSDTSLSTVNSIGMAPGIPYNVTNNATIDTVTGSGTATLRVYGPGGPGTSWTLYSGAGQQTIPAYTASVQYSSSAFVCLSITYFQGNFLANGQEVTREGASTSYNYYIEATYSDTINDSVVLVGTFTAISAPPAGTAPGSGGSGGTGGGGGSNPACTVEGTFIDTPSGSISNTDLYHHLKLGLPTQIMGLNLPETISDAHWVWVTHYNKLTIGDVVIKCSDTHTLKVDGKHIHCSLIPDGSQVEMRDGTTRVMHKEVVHESVRVLQITISGPSHEYSTQGVLTHNYLKTAQ